MARGKGRKEPPSGKDARRGSVAGKGASAGDIAESDPAKKPFLPEVLDRTVIAIPLLKDIKKKGSSEPIPVIIDLNLLFPGGRDGARQRAREVVDEALRAAGGAPAESLDDVKSQFSQQYLFGRFSGAVIQEIVRLDGQSGVRTHSIFRIWPDFEIKPLITRSLSTVKADAARSAFAAVGEGIVWGIVDSGIDGDHPHFLAQKNLELSPPLAHRDFTGLGSGEQSPLADVFGHGTHVAGIVGGELKAAPGTRVHAVSRHRDEAGEVTYETLELDSASGMAPRCKLLSLKVLDDDGVGRASNLIAAIDYIQEINGRGRHIQIHGVNMSVGYDFEPEWFACGQSPLCVEVDRLVRSGVVVVVAAGNTGYGWAETAFRGTIAAGMDLTINDPGNAELAITVGSTHREMPHVYGVSYFSSKGPTGDGRLKPDLVAPGEKILSCAVGARRAEIETKVGGPCEYREESGTSMAAPHVSGVIAAFLSVRREFIGQPERVKQIFLSTATDLRRERYFQGHGLVDLMRAIQSV